MEKRAVLKNYGLLGAMLAAMLTGGVTGWLWPAAAGTVHPLGQIFINLMFCVVVPLVFSSIAGAIAGMRSVRRAGRIMGVTVLTFVVTGILAAVLMFLLMKAFPPVLTPWQSLPTEAVGDYAAPGQLLVNFFTAEDFVGLLSRRAMLPLIVFFRAAGLRRQSRRRPRRPGGPWPDRRHAGDDAADPPADLLCPGGLFRHLRRAGGGLWPQDRRGLWPGHGGVLPPVLRVPLHRLSPDGPAGRRAGRHRRHAAAHRSPGP